jgi:hypothetical protein
MGLFFKCQKCSEVVPPPHFRTEGGTTTCLKCADVTWEEYAQALEELGGSRYGNLWAPGVEERALKLSKERKDAVAELEWYPTGVLVLSEADESQGVILRADQGYGSARIFKDLAWDLLLCDVGPYRRREDGKTYVESRHLADLNCGGHSTSLEEAKAESGRLLLNLRPLVGLLTYLKLAKQP